MKRAIPWTIAALFFVAFVASFAELRRLRVRFGEITQHHFQDHQEVREFIIRSALDGTEGPIVIFGDSLVEMADFPKIVCGSAVINAGIGSATTPDFMRLAPKLLEHSKPAAIVVALGANDPPNNTKDAGALLRKLRSLSSVVLSAPTTRQNFTPDSFLADGIHLTRLASARWVSKITSALEQAIENCD